MIWGVEVTINNIITPVIQWFEFNVATSLIILLGIDFLERQLFSVNKSHKNLKVVGLKKSIIFLDCHTLSPLLRLGWFLWPD